MKKFKTIFVTILAVVMAMGIGAAVAACSKGPQVVLQYSKETTQKMDGEQIDPPAVDHLDFYDDGKLSVNLEIATVFGFKDPLKYDTTWKVENNDLVIEKSATITINFAGADMENYYELKSTKSADGITIGLWQSGADMSTILHFDLTKEQAQSLGVTFE